MEFSNNLFGNFSVIRSSQEQLFLCFSSLNLGHVLSSLDSIVGVLFEVSSNGDWENVVEFVLHLVQYIVDKIPVIIVARLSVSDNKQSCQLRIVILGHFVTDIVHIL